MPGTTTSDDEPGDEDEQLQLELEDFGKAKYEEIEGTKAVVREARRILREVVSGERRAERLAKPKPEKWQRRKSDKDKR